MSGNCLRIHFLNVGHGDCTIIEHPSGRISVIDINNGTKIDEDSYKEIEEVLMPEPQVQQAVSAGLMGYQAPPVSSAKGLASLALLGNQAPPAHSAKGLASLLLGLQPAYEEYQKLAEKGYRQTLTNPVEYLENLCEHTGRKKTIFRYIQTHPDMDHMRGLTALLDHDFEIINFWDTANTKDTPDFSKVIGDDKTDWETYQKLRKGEDVIRLIRNRGDVGTYWNQGKADGDPGDGIEILSPTTQITATANENEKHNNHSYVLRITYGGVSVILGGDAESEVWEDLVNTYGNGLKCDVLKASHHGRNSGYHQQAVKIMNPGLTVVSVGKKPATDASNKYKNYSDTVLSTRWSGNIIVSIWPDGTARYEEEYGE